MFDKIKYFVGLLTLLVFIAPPLAAAEELSGDQIYTQICANCHEAGVPKAASRGMMGFMSPISVHRAITTGVMADMAADLSDQEKINVVKFITGKSPLDSVGTFRGKTCQGAQAEFDRNQPPALVGWGFTSDNRRMISDEIAGITRDNVKKLKLKWAFGFPNAVRARSHPASAGGAVFVGSQDGTLYALDRETGCIRWSFIADAEIRTGLVIAPWQAGDSNATSLTYFGDFLGTVYAVDTFTGQEVWKIRPDDHPNATITATPTLYENRLYISVSALEVINAVNPAYECCSFRGAVVAVNATNGEVHWKTHTISDPLAPHGTNTAGTQQYGPSGAPVWNTPAIDSKRRQIYFGTGENFSSPATKTSDAIFAIGLDQGEVRWTFQATPNDAWNASCTVAPRGSCPEEDGPDFDFGGQSVIAQHSDGTDYVVAGQKSGVVWALNPDTGELVWKNKVGRGGVIGGVHFGISVSGDRVIVPISDAVADPAYIDNYEGTPRPGLYALDLKTGAYLWQWAAEDVCGEDPLCMKGNSAVPTTTEQLAIAGSLDGHLRIHDIQSGEILWDFDTTKEVASVTGIPAKGGAMEGGAAALLQDGMMFFNSGYLFNQHMPGNAFYAFEIAD
jgi:polyvinyl alcohol dehydrogenase (cytochrome)